MLVLILHTSVQILRVPPLAHLCPDNVLQPLPEVRHGAGAKGTHCATKHHLNMAGAGYASGDSTIGGTMGPVTNVHVAMFR